MTTEQTTNHCEHIDTVIKTLAEAVTALDGIVGHESGDARELSDVAANALAVKLNRLQEQADYIVRQLERVTYTL